MFQENWGQEMVDSGIHRGGGIEHQDAEHKLVGKKMRTADFATMYTMLPHSRLLHAVKVAWDRAMEFQAMQSGTDSTATWGLRQDPEGAYNFITLEKEVEHAGGGCFTFNLWNLECTKHGSNKE